MWKRNLKVPWALQLSLKYDFVLDWYIYLAWFLIIDVTGLSMLYCFASNTQLSHFPVLLHYLSRGVFRTSIKLIEKIDI